MKLALGLLFSALVAATPVPNPDAEADAADAVTQPRPMPPCVEPVPGKCRLIYCIRAPCLQNCCGDGAHHCPSGYSCYGSPNKCCPPGWWCDAPGGPRNCRIETC
ncbi:hypothetical protein CspHIS471_0105160 [Cutaneotrichosporon sp. HIS471]|nr:hypothetical protein CspHIS471_0105160 [Cutaneotrichosporon sp. HIS471]